MIYTAVRHQGAAQRIDTEYFCRFKRSVVCGTQQEIVGHHSRLFLEMLR